MCEEIPKTLRGPLSVITRAWVAGALLFGLAYGIAGVTGTLEVEYTHGSDSRLGSAIFLLCGGAWMGAMIGFLVGCMVVVVQWLIGRWKRNTPT